MYQEEHVVIGPVNHSNIMEVADKAYAVTGFPVTSAAALSVVHGKERPAGGGSRNSPLTSWTQPLRGRFKK
jgi:hypothetical protein